MIQFNMSRELMHYFMKHPSRAGAAIRQQLLAKMDEKGDDDGTRTVSSQESPGI